MLRREQRALQDKLVFNFLHVSDLLLFWGRQIHDHRMNANLLCGNSCAMRASARPNNCFTSFKFPPTTSSSSRRHPHSRQQHVHVVCQAEAARAAGRMTYRPQSYAELVQDATKSVLTAIEDGIQLMEVEFPAIPTNIDGGHHASLCNRKQQAH